MKSKLIALAATGLLSAMTYASEPDTQVIEYYHPDLKHYFITASATDARFVDAGSAGQGWVRTGRNFGAWSTREVASADASMVHRFYSAGANSHVYVASDADISLLKGLEASERAAIVGTDKRFLGWGDEGEAFLVLLPKNGQCPTGTEAITRVYNHGFTTGEGSNHRYVSDDSLTHSMEDRKWQSEGIVFCSPVSTAAAASASANASARNSSAVTAGSFSGTVQFEVEEVGKPEVKVRNALSLTLAADGAVSGTGGGCNFTGTVAAKNATASLRGGSLAATGCTDARFNGTYSRVEIEQFSAGAIDIRLKSEDNVREAQIEGVLTNTNTTPPPTPTPDPSDGAALAGDYSGILTVMVTERPSGQPEKIILNVNQLVTLKVSATGTISGAVQGCLISGTITPVANHRFTGSIVVTGCSEPRLNGNYDVAVHLEGGAIEVELEREVELGGVRTKVSIEGDLARSTPVTTPPTPVPPATGIAIAGSFAGDASFLATRRPAGGKEVTVVDKTQALTLTVSSTGNVTGAGGGCSFSGNLASSTPAPGIFTGTIVAAGCTDAIITGNFAATASREDANGLELELEREAETNGERVKVKIKARLSKQ